MLINLVISAKPVKDTGLQVAVQVAQIDAPNGLHHPALKSNGRVFSFGVDAPICDSMASVLNLGERKFFNGTWNGFRCLEEQKISVPCREENGDDCTGGFSIMVSISSSMDEGSRSCIQETMMGNINGFPSPISCLPGVPWPYPWNSAVPPTTFCPSAGAFLVSFYPPAAYWNYGIPGTWNIPLLSPSLLLLQTKRLQPRKNGSVLVPKTLRIDDRSEAAKSSIWATVGIKNESLSGGGLFKAFHPKSVEKNHIAETSPVLRAKPAALSRSLNFHESS
ncbi:putative zinc finger protein [Corchorus olitorius]|uniref:Zinc finger protein n=1 Tax=Corchorus olitorius TaxID=93759 RepID=A0A1R3FZI9_9ROSI|nr:putative zinc finger protein [Corchorus olitorius]